MTKRKFISLFMVFTIFLTLPCGCKKEDVSYDVAPDDADNALKKELSVPNEVSYEFEAMASGLEKISVDTENIIVPDVSALPAVSYEKTVADSAYRKNVAESVFDADDGIYAYDGKSMNRQMISELTDYYNTCIEKSAELNDDVAGENYSNMLSELLSDSQNANELPPAGDYEGSSYIGYIDGKSYLLEFDIDGGGFCLKRYPEELTVYMTDAEDKPYAVCLNSYGDGYEQDLINTGDLNVSDMSKDEAVEYAVNFLNSIGITDVTAVEASTNEWLCYDLILGQTEPETIYDGYYITFTNEVNSLIPYIGYYDGVQSLVRDGMAREGLTVQTYEICLNDNGIIKAVCHDNYHKADAGTEESQPVRLLSWDEMLEKADSCIGEYYSDKNVTGSICFNYVELSYYMMWEEDGTYALRPAWFFLTLSDVSLYYDADMYPEEMLIIDAESGLPVDP